MQSLKVFLIIASGAGNRPREISQVGTLTQKTVFWSLRVLGCEELKGNYRPVLRLVEAIVDPEDGRKRLYALTAKGEEFAREIAGAID
jgi:DNA-binding MarR family transcriptional regulator